MGFKRPRHSSSRGRRNANVFFYLSNEVTMVLLVLNILDSQQIEIYLSYCIISLNCEQFSTGNKKLLWKYKYISSSENRM